MKEFIITVNDAERRLDRFLRKYLCNASLGQIYKIIRKDVKINGKRQSEAYILKEGDLLSLYLSDEDFDVFSKVKDNSKLAVKRQFKIVYEDENILIANKPRGLLTHGDAQEKKNHLANQVKDYLIEKGEFLPKLEKVFAPAPANRIDRNTTGLVLFGKNASSLKELNEMMRENRVQKFYQTIVHGVIDSELVLKDRLHKDSERNRVSISSDDGVEIETIVRPVEILNNDTTLVEVELITGRSHQIRAHLSSIGHPIIGDSKYATKRYMDANRLFLKRYNLSTQLLHAECVVFADAGGVLSYLSGKCFYADLPEDFINIIIDSGGNYERR